MSIISATHGDTRLSREFWQKTELLNNGCWEWTGRTSTMRTAMHGAKVAWKFAYERLVGAVIAGSKTKRLCETPLCVNPAHRLVTPPLACPTCGHTLPRSEGEAKVFATSDGGVAIDPDDREEPEPTRYSMEELVRVPSAKGSAPEPEDDPKHVPYKKGEAKLTGRFKRTSEHSDGDRFELTHGRWRSASGLTPAQNSDMLVRDGNTWEDDGDPGGPRWTEVRTEWTPDDAHKYMTIVEEN